MSRVLCEYQINLAKHLHGSTRDIIEMPYGGSHDIKYASFHLTV